MKSDIPEPKFLSVPEAAKICGVSRNTVYMWVRQGKLGAYETPGRTNLIRPSDLVKFMQENGMFIPASLTELAQEDEKLMGSQEPEGREFACSVLVVDDDPMSRSLASRALNEIAEVHQAETGYEALHILTLHPEIDIVLLDLRMPGQHGTETLREMQKICPDVKVVIVSGFAREVPEDLAEGGLIARVIEKPVTVQQMQDVVVEINEQGVEAPVG